MCREGVENEGTRGRERGAVIESTVHNRTPRRLNNRCMLPPSQAAVTLTRARGWRTQPQQTGNTH